MAGIESNSAISHLGGDRNGKKGDEDLVSVSETSGTDGVERVSPDLLKNTPSNIARLEDEIEHCQGRKKYLAQTRSPSDGSDVRWFFCKVSLAENELSASHPRKEIVGKSEYFRFGMRDSLAIEASFLQREEEYLSSWWKEYAECSEGPRGSTSSSNKLDPDQKASSESVQSVFDAVEEDRVGVPVKGGLYEVDLTRRHCFPVYWNGDNKRVLRGHWFACKGGLDWHPLREDVSEQLEFAYCGQVWHRRRFQPSGLFAARVDLQGSTPRLHALFTGEDDTWEAWLNGDASGFSGFIGLSGNGIKLRRGYSPSQSAKPTQDELRQQKEEEKDDYCSRVPVRHVVFVVHGIGQRMEKSNFVDDVGNFRDITDGLAERHITSHQRDTHRVLYIPCQWRRGLKLSGETAVEKITLEGVRGLRVMLSATVHDVLYYMSPIYCQDIINSVSNQLNKLYLQFLKRNPGYDGKVSIFGHSLGSVLSYDILCHQEHLSSQFPMDWMYKEKSKTEESSAHRNTQSSESDPLNNLQDKKTSSPYNAKHEVMSLDEDRTTSQGTLLVHEGHHGGDRSLIEYPVFPDLNERFAWAMDSTQLNAQEDTREYGFNTRDMLFKENDESLDPSQSKGSESTSGTPEKLTDEVPHELGDNVTEIKLLREEIDSLKARIAEMELMSCGKDKSGELTSGKEYIPKSYSPQIKYTKLEFKVDTFFAVGSPLGVFLALRNIRIGIAKAQDYWGEENITEEMPSCRRMCNIFHPFDPVAYRIEPLISKEYIGKSPVIIPYHKGGKRLHIGIHEFAEDIAARSQTIVDHLRSVRVKVLTLCQSNDRDTLEDIPEISNDGEQKLYGLLMMERITGSEEGRVDHMLQAKTFENAYISAIGSHTNYWRDYDTALFVLKHLYQDIPEDDPNTPCDSEGCISKNETRSKNLTERRDATGEEELPLTFSDSALVRTFSRKANKLMKKPASFN